MGKKKDERKRREREAQAGTAGEQHRAAHGGTSHDPGKHAAGARHGKKHDHAPLAGIAAAIARQMGTPAGRQVIAAGLMAAAGAIARQDTKPAPPRPAPPPAPPAPEPKPAAADAPRQPSEASKDAADRDAAGKSAGTGPFAGDTSEPPRAEMPPFSPELTKVLGSVTAGLERWMTGFGAPGKTPRDG